MLERERPCGGGSWAERRRVRRSWVLPMPLCFVSFAVGRGLLRFVWLGWVVKRLGEGGRTQVHTSRPSLR